MKTVLYQIHHAVLVTSSIEEMLLKVLCLTQKDIRWNRNEMSDRECKPEK